MNSRETTILSIALGTWMAWRFMGSTLLPVGSMSVAIAIIVLFKPWLNFRGWITLLTVNAISWVPYWYLQWFKASNTFNKEFFEAMKLAGIVSEGFMTNISLSWGLIVSVVGNFIYFCYIEPHIWERVYRKSGIWEQLNIREVGK